jgi:hypothetical protein
MQVTELEALAVRLHPRGKKVAGCMVFLFSEAIVLAKGNTRRKPLSRLLAGKRQLARPSFKEVACIPLARAVIVPFEKPLDGFTVSMAEYGICDGERGMAGSRDSAFHNARGCGALEI